MLEISLLQQMMGGGDRVQTEPREIIRRRTGKRKKESIRDKIVNCLQCQPKPIDAITIGNILGGKEIPKESYDERKKHFANVMSVLSTLHTKGGIDRMRIGGVYKYSKKQ